MLNEDAEQLLVDLMKKTLADTFALYLKVHSFHWNVEGPYFPQLHAYFGDLYEELHGAVDPIAEQIRTLGSYAPPGSLSRFKELTELPDELNIPEALDMVRVLVVDNRTLINTLMTTFKLSNQLEKDGLSNFLADRIDVHHKHDWQLKSIVK